VGRRAAAKLLTRDEALRSGEHRQAAGAVDEALTLLRPRPLRR